MTAAMISRLNVSLRNACNVSAGTVRCAAIIVGAASFMRQIYNVVRVLIPDWTLSAIVWSGFAVSFLAILVMIRRAPSFKGLVTICIVGCLAVGVALSMDLMEERVHILTYGLLGFLAARDLRRLSRAQNFFAAFVFCAATGCADELFQAVLPYRVADARDLLFDAVSACGGIVIYLYGDRGIQSTAKADPLPR